MSMPVTRCANSALDKVAQQHGEVADMLAEYGGTDLLCYRAEGPQALVIIRPSFGTRFWTGLQRRWARVWFLSRG